MIVKKIIKDFFPFYCIHCRRVVEEKGFCGRCFDMVRPLSLIGRCHICFKATFKSSVCHICVLDKPIYQSVVLFSGKGPSYSLIQSVKMGSSYSRDLVIFFLEQHLDNLSWIPDIILSFHYLFLSKEKSAYYIGKKLGSRLKKPLSQVWCSSLFFGKTFLTKKIFHKKILFLCENKTEFIEKTVQEITQKSYSQACLLSLKMKD